MDNKTKYLLAEYEALGLEPQKTVLNGIEYVIPSLYVKAARFFRCSGERRRTLRETWGGCQDRIVGKRHSDLSDGGSFCAAQ